MPKFWMQIIVVLLISLPLMSFANNKSEKKTKEISKEISKEIIWSIIPYAPIHILEGKYKGLGIADKYVQKAQKSLKGYRHVNQIMTPARAWHQIEAGELLVCHPSALKTQEREKYAYFSDPGLITPVIRALMRRDVWEEHFNGQKILNIRDYLRMNLGPLGIVSHRSYGEDVDKILNLAMKSGKHIVRASGRYGSRQLYEMLTNSRIELMLEYPWVTSYFEKALGDSNVEVVNLQIRGFPRFSPAYVACTRNEDGLKAIEGINHFLQQEIPTARNRRRMTDWLDEEEASIFEKDYLEFFKIAH